MKTLNIAISDVEYTKFGITNNVLSFSDFVEMISKELMRENVVAYQTMKPVVEQRTIGKFPYEFIQNRTKDRPISPITALRGTLHQIDTTDIREEVDRPL